MFIVLLQYVKALEKIDALLPDHIKYLEEQYSQSKFIFSGRRNPRIGGIILVNVKNKTELWNILQEDPFYINKVVEYEIVEFTPTKWDQKFASYINN